METATNEASNGNDKSPEGETSRVTAAPQKVVSPVADSPLKRAMKENENSIIQNILAPSRTSSKRAVTKTGKDGAPAAEEKKDEGGLAPLLDYLFEDGQLTRIEYDIVDKAEGAESAAQQVQLLLRILTGENKEDKALELLLEYLCTQDPTSEAVRKLTSLPHSSNPGFSGKKLRYAERHKHHQDLLESAIDAVKENFTTNHILDMTSLIKADNNGETDDNRQPLGCKRANSYSTQRQHDFYFGPQNQRMRILHQQNQQKNRDQQQQMMNKTRTAPNITTVDKPSTNIPKELTTEDLRDFYLSNGCLETIRNLILDSGAANLEALTAHGWEKVLRNMNGLLSTDVGSIKDLLSQLKCLESQQEQELEQIGRRIMETNAVPRSNGIDQNEEENLMDFQVTWDQIIYHSLFVWKQRNGSLTTFFSLIGIFQHSNLFYTADLLLQNKLEIQSRENEKDNSSVNEVAGSTHSEMFKNHNGTGRRASSTSTQSTTPEKSEFLRKFSIPLRRQAGGSKSGTPPSPPPPQHIFTTKDKVPISPVVSTDLL